MVDPDIAEALMDGVLKQDNKIDPSKYCDSTGIDKIKQIAKDFKKESADVRKQREAGQQKHVDIMSKCLRDAEVPASPVMLNLAWELTKGTRGDLDLAAKVKGDTQPPCSFSKEEYIKDNVFLNLKHDETTEKLDEDSEYCEHITVQPPDTAEAIEVCVSLYYTDDMDTKPIVAMVGMFVGDTFTQINLEGGNTFEPPWGEKGKAATPRCATVKIAEGKAEIVK